MTNYFALALLTGYTSASTTPSPVFSATWFTATDKVTQATNDANNVPLSGGRVDVAFL